MNVLRPKIVSDRGPWKLYNKRQGCSQKQIMGVAMSNNNDCYCCNPFDLENTEFDVCRASQPFPSINYACRVYDL